MQALGAVTNAQLLAAGQQPLMKVEIYVGVAWVNLNSFPITAENYIKGAGVSLGGAAMTPNPVAGKWNASMFNQDGIFHPQHPTSDYKDYLTTERLTKISIGGTYAGVPKYWQRIIGYMDVPKFSAPDYNIAISGGDYMKRLKETELRMPDNYWGDHEHFTSIASDGVTGAEIYAEVDAMDTADDGTAPYDNVANWVSTNCDFASFADAGSPSTFFVGRCINQGPAPVRLDNPNVGAAVAGDMYRVKFWHRIVGGTGLIATTVRILQASGVCVEVRYNPTDTWKEETFYFTALDTGAIQWRFRIPNVDHDLRLDEFSIYEFIPYWKQYYAIAAANEKGPYFVTIDGDPVWQGEVDEGWYYAEDAEAGPDPPSHPARIVYFDPNKTVTGGLDLIVYYFLQQEAEDVVADLLYFAGVIDPGTGIPYVDEAAALTKLIAHADYVDPDVQIDKVWFEPGTKCLDAIKKVCERCDYRFYFDYDGAPVFRPKPTWGGADFTFTDPSQIASISTYQSRNEIKNRVIIKGDKRAEPVSREDTMPSYWEGEASNAVSIANYGERTLTINNHLFQTQAAIDAMCASLVTEYKDPKWYSTLKIPFNAVPLQLGDSLQWEERLSPDLDITHTGIIRDIKIDNFNTMYKCEIVPIFLDNFDDAARNPDWTDAPNNGTITEANDVLILAIADGVHGDFWGATTDGPVCTIDLDSSKNFIITTKLNSYTVNNRTRAGLYITDSVDGTHGVHFGRTRRDEVAPTIRNGLTLIDMNSSEYAYVVMTTLPVWLRVITEGSGAGSTMKFYYSINGADWIYVDIVENETWTKAGLLVWNWNPDWSAISAPFEFFRVDIF